MTRNDCYARIVSLVNDSEKIRLLSADEAAEVCAALTRLRRLLDDMQTEDDPVYKKLFESEFDITALTVCRMFDRLS